VVARIFFCKTFWKITPEMATPSVCLNARKKLYIAPAKGRSALKAEAWAAKPCALKSMPRPMPATKDKKI
jgi:hypothetical protein